MKNQVIKKLSNKYQKAAADQGLYKVRPGDNPVTIATQAGTSTEAFIAANKMNLPLKLGAMVNLPKQKDDLVGSVGSIIGAKGPVNPTFQATPSHQMGAGVAPNYPTNTKFLDVNLTNWVGNTLNSIARATIFNPQQQSSAVLRGPNAGDWTSPNQNKSLAMSTVNTQDAAQKQAQNQVNPNTKSNYYQEPVRATVVNALTNSINGGWAPDRVPAATGQYLNNIAGVEIYDAQGNINPALVVNQNVQTGASNLNPEGTVASSANGSGSSYDASNRQTNTIVLSNGVYKNVPGTKGNMSGTNWRLPNGNLAPNKARNRRRRDKANRYPDVPVVENSLIGNETNFLVTWRAG